MIRKKLYHLSLSLCLIGALAGCSDTAQNDPPPVKKDMGDMGTKDIGQTDCRDIDKDGFFGGINCPKANDCDDTNGEINPDATEVCGDRVDNNCNMQVDENCPCQTGEVRLCSSHGDPQKLGGPEIRCKPGVQRCIEGAWSETCEGEIGPEEETCNNMDSDCNGQIDDGVRNAFGLCIKDLPPDWMPPVEDCGPTGEGNGLDDNGDGQVDEGCSCITPDFDPNLPRTNQPCYSGAPATLGVGICKGGSRDCLTGGIWGACGNEVTPEAEVCGDGLDNNCNGIVDDGCSPCVPTGAETCDGIDNDCNGIIDDGVRNACGGCGEVATDDTCGDGVDNNCNGRVDENCPCSSSNQFCYIGPAEAAGVGACVKGKQLCAGEFFGKCEGSVLPGLEQCNTDGSPNGIDEDCDGQVDEICGCPEGAQRPCGSNTGVCTYGMQTCTTGVWGECAGGTAKAETDETLCDGLDNDCDGLTDEGLLNACGKCNEPCYTQVGDPGDGNTEEGSEIIPANDPDNPQNRPGITLSKNTFIPPYLWAANHTDNTVTKFNTDTAQEEGIYYAATNPSRTAVDLDGNMWVGGRNDGRLTKIIWDVTQCPDPDGNGVNTSTVVNGTPVPANTFANIKADDCVVYSEVPNPSKPSIRGIAAAPDGKMWIGYSGGGVQSIDPKTFQLGQLYESTAIPTYVPNTQTGVLEPLMQNGQQATSNAGGVYGLVVDSAGMLYISSYNRNSIARFNTNTLEWEANLTGFECGSYGIAVDSKRRIWTGGWPGCPGVGMYDPVENKFFNFKVPNNTTAAHKAVVPVDMAPEPGVLCTNAVADSRKSFCVTGVAIEPASGDVWASFYPIGYTGRLKLNENDYAQSQWTMIGTTRDAQGNYLPGVSNDLRGVGFDRNGKAWTLGLGSDRVWKIDPQTNERDASLPMGKSIGVGSHYTYSDMTGSTALSFTAPRGLWRYIFDTKFTNAVMDAIIIEAHAPVGTTVEVRVRPLDANGAPIGTEWTPAMGYFAYPAGQAQHIVDLSSMNLQLSGNQFEMEVKLASNDPMVRPILYKLDVSWQRP